MSVPRVAIVGAGLIGQRHVELSARRGCLSAIVDPDPRAKTLADTHGVSWYSALQACLNSLAPDGVILATPNQLHVDQGLACVAAGVPVLVEKPVADTAHGAEALVAASRAAGVPVLVGHHRRHSPLIKAAKAAVDEGELGTLITLNAQFWLYKPDEYFEPAWRRQTGGGPVFINLIHDIDVVRHLCGEVVSVQAVESNRTRGFGVEDTAVVLLRFENGALGTVSITDTAVAPWSWEFTAGENTAYPHVETHCYMIAGTKAALSVPDLTLWAHSGPRSWWEPIEKRALVHETGDPLVLQLEHFLDVITGRAAPLVTAEEGLKTLRVVEAIKTAAASGHAVDLT